MNVHILWVVVIAVSISFDIQSILLSFIFYLIDRPSMIKTIYFFFYKITDDFRLPPGNYNYSFQCMLPPGLPTSFEGQIGYIRYTARVVLDIPLWPDKTFDVPFTVIKAINLNDDPSLRVILFFSVQSIQK